MASDDELRDKMRAAIVERRDRYQRHPHDAPSHDVVDALMPVICESLADAWDKGFNAGERDVLEHESTGDWDSECIRNPWRDVAAMRISLHIELHIGDEPDQRDTQLDALVEHGDNYPTPPEMHVGFRHDGDSE